jgi:hypothetical protein
LIVPYSQILPQPLLAAFEKMAQKGLRIIFADEFPDGVELPHCEKMALDRIADALPSGIILKNASPYLRYYHIKRDGKDAIMLWNEDHFNEYDSYITFPCGSDAVIYDAWKNRVYAPQKKGEAIRIKLAPDEALILSFDGELSAEATFDYRDNVPEPLDLDWDITACRAGEKESFALSETKPINLIESLGDFAGKIRYATVLQIENPAAYRVLELQNVGETAELFLNGQSCGAVVAKPYRFEVDGKLKAGENKIVIEVCTNLGYANRDRLSTYLTLPPIGMIGDLYLG